jgi:predicted nuclease of predicted toxin-antitoxin system
VNRVFIDIYLDEDVDVLVADLLTSRGFVAVSTRDAGNLGTSDSHQLSYAVRVEKALLTHNRVDFETLANSYLAAGQFHFGIIVAVRRPAYEIVRRLLLILNQVTADEMINQLRYI